MKKNFYPLAIVVFANIAFANVPNVEKVVKPQQQNLQPPAEPKLNQIVPDTENVEAFTYKDLYRENVTIEQKWAILNDLKNKSPEFAKEIYLSCIESTDWVLRVGGLKFLATLDVHTTLEKAKKLLSEDPSLLVRSAAADVLVENGLTRAKETLWAALEDSKNFHKGHSLWVRKNIASALKTVAEQTENPKWEKLLYDSDTKIREFAVEALERSNKLLLGSLSDTLTTKVELWKTRFMDMAKVANDKSTIIPKITDEVKAIDPLLETKDRGETLESKESFAEDFKFN